MAKTTRVRDQDKFMLRLPDGMRDRIKAGADRAGMSMNEAVVWCLDRYFPKPTTLNDKIAHLAELVAVIKPGADVNEGLNRLIHDLHEALNEISEGEIKVGDEFHKAVGARVQEWQEREAEEWQESNYTPFDDPGGDLDDDAPNQSEILR